VLRRPVCHEIGRGARVSLRRPKIACEYST